MEPVIKPRINRSFSANPTPSRHSIRSSAVQGITSLASIRHHTIPVNGLENHEANEHVKEHVKVAPRIHRPSSIKKILRRSSSNAANVSNRHSLYAANNGDSTNRLPKLGEYLENQNQKVPIKTPGFSFRSKALSLTAQDLMKRRSSLSFYNKEKPIIEKTQQKQQKPRQKNLSYDPGLDQNVSLTPKDVVNFYDFTRGTHPNPKQFNSLRQKPTILSPIGANLHQKSIKKKLIKSHSAHTGHTHKAQSPSKTVAVAYGQIEGEKGPISPIFVPGPIVLQPSQNCIDPKSTYSKDLFESKPVQIKRKLSLHRSLSTAGANVISRSNSFVQKSLLGKSKSFGLNPPVIETTPDQAREIVQTREVRPHTKLSRKKSIKNLLKPSKSVCQNNSPLLINIGEVKEIVPEAEPLPLPKLIEAYQKPTKVTQKPQVSLILLANSNLNSENAKNNFKLLGEILENYPLPSKFIKVNEFSDEILQEEELDDNKQMKQPTCPFKITTINAFSKISNPKIQTIINLGGFFQKEQHTLDAIALQESQIYACPKETKKFTDTFKIATKDPMTSNLQDIPHLERAISLDQTKPKSIMSNQPKSIMSQQTSVFATEITNFTCGDFQVNNFQDTGNLCNISEKVAGFMKILEKFALKNSEFLSIPSKTNGPKLKNFGTFQHLHSISQEDFEALDLSTFGDINHDSNTKTFCYCQPLLNSQNRIKVINIDTCCLIESSFDNLAKPIKSNKIKKETLYRWLSELIEKLNDDTETDVIILISNLPIHLKLNGQVEEDIQNVNDANNGQNGPKSPGNDSLKNFEKWVNFESMAAKIDQIIGNHNYAQKILAHFSSQIGQDLPDNSHGTCPLSKNTCQSIAETFLDPCSLDITYGIDLDTSISMIGHSGLDKEKDRDKNVEPCSKKENKFYYDKYRKIYHISISSMESLINPNICNFGILEFYKDFAILKGYGGVESRVLHFNDGMQLRI